MTFGPSRSAVAGLVLFSWSLAGGCTSGGDEPAQSPSVQTTQAIDEALVRGTWPVRMADATARTPFEADAGWTKLFTRAYDEGLAAFAGAGGVPLARMHVEYAATYRQAALLSASSTTEVYGVDVQPTDPADVVYLLAVSQVLLGRTDEARASFARASEVELTPPLDAGLAAWSTWVSGGATWPPDDALAALRPELGEAQVGTAPALLPLPPVSLTERSEDARLVAAGDPTDLYLLSRWHEAAAKAAAPGQEAVVDAMLDPWRLPGEVTADDRAAPPAELDDAWLFGGFILAPADLGFEAALRADGIAAVSAWSDRSPLAAVVAPAVVDSRVVVDKMLDQAAWLGKQSEAAMVSVAGQEEAYQQAFGDIARVAALRAGMLAADATGERRDAGVLRINALERSTGPVADPVFFASVAAWDAGNRNPLRAQELVQSLLARFPSIEAARYPLDAMHVRLGRNAAPATPVH